MMPTKWISKDNWLSSVKVSSKRKAVQSDPQQQHVVGGQIFKTKQLGSWICSTLPNMPEANIKNTHVSTLSFSCRHKSWCFPPIYPCGYYSFRRYHKFKTFLKRAKRFFCHSHWYRLFHLTYCKILFDFLLARGKVRSLCALKQLFEIICIIFLNFSRFQMASASAEVTLQRRTFSFNAHSDAIRPLSPKAISSRRFG